MSDLPPQRGTGERALTLSRIRQALQVPTSEHVKRDRHAHAPADRGAAASGDISAADISSLLPAVGETLQERIAKFQERSVALRTDFSVVQTAAQAAEHLNTLAADLNWQRVALHDAELLNQIAPSLATPSLRVSCDYNAHELEQCDAGITVCDALIAQTGSILLTSRSAGGRALSVLPPHHVVIATADQLLPDLPAAYALFAARYGADWPSFATFITGPSRTGDIERILVLGAHGPKKLTVILINDK